MQYVDDIGIGANQRISSSRTLGQFSNASKVRFPNSKKQVQKYIGFANDYRNNIPRLSEKHIGMYELLKADAKVRILVDLVDNFREITASLAEACGLALREPGTGKQNVLMTNASFRASGYALMIEEYDERKLLSVRKILAPVAFGSRVFSPAQLKMSIYCKDFLAIYHAALEYSHILWETKIPTLLLTENRSVTRFFSNQDDATRTVHFGMPATTSYDLISVTCM